MNVSPELSPDGSKVIFFSERDLFSIDLYVADAKTGEVIRKVTDTATSAHIESLQFISSAGAWDRTSKKFVFPGIAGGHPVLTIVDVERGKKEREITIEGVDEVTNPAWSPDGATIAFSGLAGGFNGPVRLRPEGRPAAAPDHRRVRGARSGLVARRQDAGLQHRPLHDQPADAGGRRPAAGGHRRRVGRTSSAAGGFEQAKNISPQWSADGRVALLPVRSRRHHEHLSHGVRRRDDAVDESPDRRQRHHRAEPGAVGCRRTARVQRVRGQRLHDLRARVGRAARRAAAVVHAADQRGGAAAAEGRRRTGLRGGHRTRRSDCPPEQPRRRRQRNTSRSSALDFAGQPTVARRRAIRSAPTPPAACRWSFSDMLGNHSLYAGAQATNRFDEFGGNVHLHQPHAPLELGRGGRSDTVRLSRRSTRA